MSYDRFKHLLPVLPGMTHPTGVENVFTHAARAMRTAFHNHLWVNIIPRLSRLCKAWVAKRCARTRQRGPFSALDLLRAIESGKKLQDADGDALVAEAREALGLRPKQKLTQQFAKSPSRRVTLLFFLRWLQLRLQALGVRGLRLMPVFRVQRQHVSLDATTQLSLLKQMGLVPSDLRGQPMTHPLVREWLSAVFEPPKTKKKQPYSGFLATDGVAASFVMGDLPEDDDRTDSEEVQPTEAGPMEEEPTEAEPVVPPPPPAFPPVVVVVDPGRHTVVHLATQLPGETDARDWSLSRKHYYNCAGLTRSLAKQAAWDQGAPWQHLGSEGSLRATALAPLIQHLEAYNRVAEDWWRHTLQRKRAKVRFRTYGGRKRCLDTFFGGVLSGVRAATGGTAPVHFAYGAATFSPSGGGKPATPTTAAYKACSRLERPGVVVQKQSECRTSRQCCHCHGDVEPCWRRCAVTLAGRPDGGVGLALEVQQGHSAVVPRKATYERGLLWCPTCSRFLNRDKSAALCIAYLYTETQLLGRSVPRAFQARRRAARRH